MSSLILPSDLEAPGGVIATERRMSLRHLGRAETLILRDNDVMRDGLHVSLVNISAGGISVISSVPLRTREQIKIRLRNDIQRFRAELRGVVRWVQPTPGEQFLTGIEFYSRLMPLDVMMFRRAGVADAFDAASRVWV